MTWENICICLRQFCVCVVCMCYICLKSRCLFFFVARVFKYRHETIAKENRELNNEKEGSCTELRKLQQIENDLKSKIEEIKQTLATQQPTLVEKLRRKKKNKKCMT